MRYGVQVATHITGTGHKNLALPDGKLIKSEEGEVSFQVSLENVGSRMARPEVWVELYDDQGTAFGRREGVQNRIYPGTSVKQAIRLGDLGTGEYRALVILDDGENDVFGAKYRLKIE
ncbi:MAG: hypothetical protein ACI80V_001205 [Rhodothermales bacterium]|jgi:hypothetical protein